MLGTYFRGNSHYNPYGQKCLLYYPLPLKERYFQHPIEDPSTFGRFQKLNTCFQRFDGPFDNIGNPDGPDDYQIKRNEILNSGTCNYVITDYLGRGTFGQVALAWEPQARKYVAMKILKRNDLYSQQGLTEISLLKHINQRIMDHVVCLLENFYHCGHICMVFELLEQDLFDFIKDKTTNPFYFLGIRAISFQILKVLVKLKEIGIIHTDLKPENIMIVNQRKWPYYIKIIDFGSALRSSGNKVPSYIQSRFYRAPEVIVGSNFDYKIDMWSLGCIIAEMVTGWAIFPGSCQYEQIKYIQRACGPFPDDVISTGKNSIKFFKKKNSWKLIDNIEYSKKTGTKTRSLSRYSIKDFSVISDKLLRDSKNFENMSILQIYKLDVEYFILALKSILNVDPTKRPSPEEAINFPFWKFFHHIPTNSRWFHSSVQTMYISRAWTLGIEYSSNYRPPMQTLQNFGGRYRTDRIGMNYRPCYIP